MYGNDGSPRIAQVKFYALREMEAGSVGRCSSLVHESSSERPYQGSALEEEGMWQPAMLKENLWDLSND